MRWIKTAAVMLAVCSMLFATASFAATPKLSEDLYRADKIIGASVENPQGKNLGDIKDIVLDTQGRVRYAVLAFGGFLGMGEKYFAVPWEALTPETGQQPGDRNKFVLNIDQEKLKNAPGFDKNNWPNMADRQWGEQVYAYYGITPYWQREASMAGASAMMVAATVQNIDQNTKRLRMRTTNDETIEFQAPAGLLSQLQDGDRVEVVIHKQVSTAPMPSEQPSSNPTRSEPPAR